MTSTQTEAGLWFRVSTTDQTSDNQVPDVQTFLSHHGYTEAARYTVSDSAWKDGGGPEYRKALAQTLDDAHKGKFKILVVWALDRIVRSDEGGAEAALRIIRQFRQRGCMVVSVQESWLNASPEVQDILVAFAGWQAEKESARKSQRIKAGVARRRAAGQPVGRVKGAKDRKPRKRSGYVKRWENERAA